MDLLRYLAPLIVGLIVNEAVDISPWLARKTIRWAARRIPDAELAQRYEEEWSGFLDERPGKLLKLTYALTFLAPAIRMRREALGRISWPRRLTRAHTTFWTGPKMPRGWILFPLGMASQMWAERIPTTPDHNALFYAVSTVAGTAMIYLATGLSTYTRFLRRQAALAATGDTEAHAHLDRWHGTRHCPEHR
ncbi:hypothetical protein L1606_04720 [Streptomyces spororaveus]|uniref:hypothetical protein n=1 Tax=Streptomyces spororaveus TaxID=284039 RepID=UPI00207AB426|nr:hypothetical protein [Streptomyces spororaveus]MCM9077391.1 hypothetical protein [Streptomyces spororaveus]